MEGITLLDAAVWTVVLKECSNVRISNIKIVNGRYYSTDGINPVNCQDVAIEDCFFRCTDDNISVKGLNWGLPSRNILVERCTFWSDNNNAVVVGPEEQVLAARERDLPQLRHPLRARRPGNQGRHERDSAR